MSLMQNSAVVLVDPFVACEEVSRFFNSLPVYTFVLITERENSSLPFVEHAPYDCMFYSEKKLDDDIALIKEVLQYRKKNLLFVLGGLDDSSVYAETLLAVLLPECANSEECRLRTDKYALSEFLYKHGLEKDPVYTLTVDQVPDFISREYERLTFPLIIKPRCYGSCQEGVSVVSNLSGLVKQLYDTFSQTHGLTGNVFDELLIQKKYEGAFYAVNVASVGGQHKIVDIFRYHIIQGVVVAYFELVEVGSPVYKKLAIYIDSLLTTIGFRYGVNHIELIVCDNGDIHTIDFNPRLSGCSGILLYASEQRTGFHELSLFFHWLVLGHLPENLVALPVYTGGFSLHNTQKISAYEHLDKELLRLKSNYVRILSRRLFCNNTECKTLYGSLVRVITLSDADSAVVKEDLDFLCQLSGFKRLAS